MAVPEIVTVENVNAKNYTTEGKEKNKNGSQRKGSVSPSLNQSHTSPLNAQFSELTKSSPVNDFSKMSNRHNTKSSASPMNLVVNN
jgi:hypothetical protein